MTPPTGSHAWHALAPPDVATLLGTDLEAGLTPVETRCRLALGGPNRIADQPETPLWRLWLASPGASEGGS